MSEANTREVDPLVGCSWAGGARIVDAELEAVRLTIWRTNGDLVAKLYLSHGN
jgi:hypothetical protein